MCERLRSFVCDFRGRIPLRVLLAVPSHQGDQDGHADHVVTTLARRLTREHLNVPLGVVQNHGPLSQTLREDVTCHALHGLPMSLTALPLLRLVKQYHR